MLDNVVINGFRGLQIMLQGTSRFNLIVGPNNSGKTSLLEALFIHCAPLNCKTLLSLLSFRAGGFVPNQRYLFDELKWFFSEPSKPEKKFIHIKSTWRNLNRVTTISRIDTDFGSENSLVPEAKKFYHSYSSESFQEKENIIRDVQGISLGKLIFTFESDLQKKIEQEFEFVNIGAIKIDAPKVKTDINAVFSDPFTHRHVDAGVEQYSEAVKKGFDENCLRLMQKVDPHIKKIDILLTSAKTPQLYMTHELLGQSPFSNLGDGIRRIAMIAFQLAQAENGVIFIDELENSIHVSALNHFVDLLIDLSESLNIQIFATTHSLECIDAVMTTPQRRNGTQKLSLFKISSENKTRTCKKIAGEELEKIRLELGQDVRF